MDDKAVVEFYNYREDKKTEILIPLEITANDLALALNEAFSLEMNTDDMFNCYLAAENPIAFLRGNKTLAEFGIRNGSCIIYRRD